MGMSDSEYNRVVEELKESRAHDIGAVGHDRATLELMRANTVTAITLVSCHVRPRSSESRTRARALEARVEALPRHRVTHAMMMRVHDVWDRVKAGTQTDIDKALAEIDVEIATAERAA